MEWFSAICKKKKNKNFQLFCKYGRIFSWYRYTEGFSTNLKPIYVRNCSCCAKTEESSAGMQIGYNFQLICSHGRIFSWHSNMQDSSAGTQKRRFPPGMQIRKVFIWNVYTEGISIFRKHI